MDDLGHDVVLIDGVCVLCHGLARFVSRRDPERALRFASLQSPAGRRLLEDHGLDPEMLDSMVLLSGGRLYLRSDAALRVAGRLRGPARLARILLILPRGLRDLCYRIVARRRYRWFGRKDVCALPTADLAGRILEDGNTPAVTD